MKRIFVILVLIAANCHFVYSQENLVVFFRDALTDSIPVFSNDTCSAYVNAIKENKEEENWHDVEIIEKSDKRYRVIISSVKEANVAPEEGWVYREQCGVWLRAGYEKPDHWKVHLYATPGASKPIEIMEYRSFRDFCDFAWENAVPVIDYELKDGVYWIKTIITKGTQRLIGWTTDYCPNIFASCN